MNRSHFQRGVATFKCRACGRLTRNPDEGGTRLCAEDFDLAGYFNTLQDGGPEEVKKYALSIISNCSRIQSMGGKLDSDARELLAIVTPPANPPAAQ